MHHERARGLLRDGAEDLNISEALKKIITPVDGSEGCAKAARFAARLAKAVGAELELAHVYDSTVISVMARPRSIRVSITGSGPSSSRWRSRRPWRPWVSASSDSQ